MVRAFRLLVLALLIWDELAAVFLVASELKVLIEVGYALASVAFLLTLFISNTDGFWIFDGEVKRFCEVEVLGILENRVDLDLSYFGLKVQIVFDAE